MDWNDRFARLSATQQLGVAAALAERVLPLAGPISALDDGLALVWLQIGGRPTKKLELARSLNAAIESASLQPDDDSAKSSAARSVFGVLEAALHNSAAAADAIECALAAVKSQGDDAQSDELRWLLWAIDAAEQTGAVERGVFAASEAPTSKWRTNMSSDNLPLFGARS